MFWAGHHHHHFQCCLHDPHHHQPQPQHQQQHLVYQRVSCKSRPSTNSCYSWAIESNLFVNFITNQSGAVSSQAVLWLVGYSMKCSAAMRTAPADSTVWIHPCFRLNRDVNPQWNQAINFLSDPGVPGVWSMGLGLCPYKTICRLNWCDPGWWG